MDDWKKRDKLRESLKRISLALVVIISIFIYAYAWNQNHGFIGLFITLLCAFVLSLIFDAFSYVLSYAIPFVLPIAFGLINIYLGKKRRKKELHAERLREQQYYKSLSLENIKSIYQLGNYRSYNPKVTVEELLFGINLENQEILDSLFSENININHMDENGNTILHKAAKNNNTNAIKFFLKNGAKIKKENKNKETPLVLATLNRQLASMKLLVENGAKLDLSNTKQMENITKTLFSNTCKNLFEAVSNGDENAINFFLTSGADLYGKDHLKRNVLEIAAAEGHKKLLNIFLKDERLKFDINDIQTVENITNLLFKRKYKNLLEATEKKDLDAFEFFLNNEANVLMFNKNGQNSLIISINKGFIEGTYKLFEYIKLDINRKDKKGCSALSYATEFGHFEVIANLLHRHADTKVLDNNENSLLHKASLSGNLKTLEYILRLNLDTEHINTDNKTALILAVENGYTDLVKKLIKNGANDKIVDKNKRTLLNISADYLHKDLVNLFLDRGQTFDISNVKDTQNITKTLFNSAYKDIVEATQNHDIKAIKFILANGGDINVVDNYSNSALILATKNNDFDIVSFLLKNGAFKKSKDYQNRTALIWAACKGYTKILDLLLDKDSLFNKVIDEIELSGYDKINLKITNILVNQLGALLTYKTNYKDHFDWSTKLDEVKKILQLKDIRLIDNNNNDEYLIQVYDNSNEAKMIKGLLVNSKQPEFVKIVLDKNRTYIFFKNISGTMLEHWNEQKTYIEDELEIAVEIEEYDQSHMLYPKYGREKFILVIESLISVMPSLLDIGGKYLKTVNEDGFNVSYFVDIHDTNKWNNAKDKIIELIGKRINIVEDLKTVKLVETIEVAIPKLLDLIDTNKRYPELYYVQEDGVNRLYFYTFLPELDLNIWKEKSRKTNFRTLFNEPNKVYKLDIYDKTNEELYDANFYTGQLIVLKEFAKIPTKEEAKNLFSLNELEENKIFWGYGSSSKKYYTDINKFQNMMIIGSAGSGKSNFINGVLLSLLNSAHLIKKMYLIDLKSGIEFTKYKDLESKKVDVFGRGTKPSKLLKALREIEAEMYLREEYLVSNKLLKIEDNPIFIIIDEFAQINLMNAQGEEVKAKEEINNILIRLGTRARSANIKLIVQTQDPISVGDDLKVHLQSRALLKTNKDFDKENTLINSDMMEEQGIKHTKFDKGRFVFENYNDGDTVFMELQFPFINPNDELYKKYIEKAQTDTNLDDSIFDEFKDYIRGEYPYLAYTKLLVMDEVIEDTLVDIAAETHEINEFDFESLLKEEDFKEVNVLHSSSLNILDDLKGNK